MVSYTKHFVGFADNLSSPSQIAAFQKTDADAWYATTRDGISTTDTTGLSISDGDILNIILTSSSAKFFVNGTLVATHTTNLPTGALKFGSSVRAIQAPTTAASHSVDFMSIKRY